MGTPRAKPAHARRPSYQELLTENARLREQVERLTRQVEKLTGLLEEARRAGKRQAAPFRKQDQPATEPKKLGRKPGQRHGRHAHRSVPPRFDVHIGACDDCGRPVPGRHAWETSSARGAAASQLGPNVHALLALLNKEWGLSHGKSVKLLATLFPELHLTRATNVRSIERTAKRCQGAYEQIRQDLRGASEVAPDETGWRVEGRLAWLHAFVSRRATCYVIDPTRSHEPAESCSRSLGPERLCTTADASTIDSSKRFINNACDTCSVAVRNCSKQRAAAADRRLAVYRLDSSPSFHDAMLECALANSHNVQKHNNVAALGFPFW